MKKKKIITITVLFLLILILSFLIFTVFNIFYNKYSCEANYLDFANKNENVIFSINKCVLFSNCNAKNKTNSTTSFTIENLYQYTDIALFINNNSKENTLENTLKNVKINNLKFSTSPEIGKQNIFYKNINSFAENIIPQENVFEDELIFNISSNDNEDLRVPTLYNNCANPITLTYINNNLKTDYAIPDNTGSITYDGSLLKRCGILLNSLNAKFAFDIYITNNLDQEFKCTVYIEPPIENKDKSLYDGSLTVTQNTNYNFYRYK